MAAARAPRRALPLLTRPSASRCCVEWNATAADVPARRHACPTLFEAQARAHAGRARRRVRGPRRLTYRQLDARANQLARHLRRLGVAPEVARGPVRGALAGAASSALLAILKAGGAYVPLDPAYPRERLAFMLQDCRRRRVLVTAAVAWRQLPSRDCPPWCLDSDVAALARQPAHRAYAGRAPGQPRVRRLHLRLHRPAQGRRHSARRRACTVFGDTTTRT